ncbi:hypothetical protein SCLCIDRAFT_8738 [Scleroderma citrinum Foug A]|uniref:Uncharacterized protein n=1 Tax=Scleroderma citrinum Foug A TaxID=1036808 RepID=A0A0C3E6Y4_9AGAM|nr:hypothetical protein SCLCIDRAFT_8738 [Scleroderma citrinum Foug A]
MLSLSKRLDQRDRSTTGHFRVIKMYNGRNHFVIPFIVRISVTLIHAMSHGSAMPLRSKAATSSETAHPPSFATSEIIPPLEIGESALNQPPVLSDAVINITPPLSSFHYQLGKDVYLFLYLGRSLRGHEVPRPWPDDSILPITFASDNLLHYSIAAQPKRIHCVDMNACQGHLLELKLAAINALKYDEFFALFGKGCHPNFRAL